MSELKLGTTVPDFINDRIGDIKDALEDCKPFSPFDDEDNEWLMEVAGREAQNIVEFVKAINMFHKEERTRADVFNKETEAMSRGLINPEIIGEDE